MLSATILSLASIVHASQHILNGLPHPALWNRTCNSEDEEVLSLTRLRDPYCLKTEVHTSNSTTADAQAAHPSPESPWTEKPTCLQTSDEKKLYCVYTSATFAHGRGISIFTTPSIAEQLAQSPAFVNPELLDDFNLETNPLYTVQPLPGRGMGVIMNRSVHRADSLFAYTPVLIINRNVFGTFREDDLFPFQRTAIDRLPPRARDLFLGLHGHFGGDKVDDIIHTNSFQVNLGSEKEPHNIVLPETSRMNHDCRPSAQYYFDVDTLTHHTHAIRSIQAGEELTISYTDITVSRAVRQEAIKKSWGFGCLCSLCTQREIFTRESDKRLDLIERLEKHLDDWTDESIATPEMAETVISLYKQERLHAPIAIAYTYAALAHSAVGDAHSAVRYAALAVEANILNSGPAFSDVEATREIMHDPTKHWSWKLRLRD